MDHCLGCGIELLQASTIEADLTSVYDRTRPYRVVECAACGLAQTLPRPTLDELREIYASSYAYDMHNLVAAEKKRRAQGLLDLVASARLPEQVVEFGCGSGVLLAELQARGFDVHGCELDPGASAEAAALVGADRVSNQTLEDYIEANRRLTGWVVMSHTLEHLLNPREALSALRSKMDPGAPLLLVVPNLDARPPGPLAKYWGYWQVPVHLTHFTQQSLTTLLGRTGFTVQAVGHRSADFMSMGLFSANVLGLKQSSIEPGRLTQVGLKAASSVWARTYRWGRQDLIVLARKSG